jgi:thiol-disulfide isomerase/thioredoxin
MPIIATFGLMLSMRAGFDPVQTLADIKAFQNTQFAAAQKAQTQEAFSEARKKIKAKVEETLKDVKVEEVDSRGSLPLAQIYAAGEMWAPALTAIEKFLSSAEPGEIYMGESMAIQFASRSKNLDSLLVHTDKIKFSTAQQVVSFSQTWMSDPFNLVLASKNVDEAIVIAEQIENKLVAVSLLDVDSRTFIRGFFGESLAEVLSEAGKTEAALKKIDSTLSVVGDKSSRGLKMLKTRLQLVGAPVPELSFTKGYGTYSATEMKGKVLLIDFFAHWCGPCKAGFPEMRKLYSELHSKGLEIVSVTKYYGYFGKDNREKRDMTPEVEFEKMAGFVKEFELPWSVQLGDAENFSRFGVTSIPTLAVVDKKGIVRKLRIGYDPDSIEAFKKELETLLSE